MGNVTNPNKIVKVGQLNYFKSKADAKYANQSTLPELASEEEVRAIVTSYV